VLGARRLAAATLALALLAGGAPGAAQEDADRDRARDLAKEGIALLEAGEAEAAAEKLEAAEQLFHAPTHLLYLARARTALGQLVEAHGLYVRILVEDIPNYAPLPFHKARASAASEAAELRARIATVRVRVRGAPAAGLLVELDGRSVQTALLAEPIAVAPGDHDIVIRAAGYQPAIRSFLATIGAVAEIDLGLSPIVPPSDDALPPPEPERSDALGIAGGVLLGVAGGALLGGAIAGAVTLQRASDIKDRCPDGVCPLEESGTVDEAMVVGNVSTALFVVGGAVGAAGIVLVALHASSGDAATALDLRVAPAGAVIVGSF
jgi:hypothetical protein